MIFSTIPSLGLIKSTGEETFNLFIAVEKSVRQLLPKHLIGSKSSMSLQVIALLRKSMSNFIGL